MSDNIFDSLLPDQKQKVLHLIRRLAQETAEHSRYQKLYEDSLQQITLLRERNRKLKLDNDSMKDRLNNSFSVISRVRAKFEQRQKEQCVYSKSGSTGGHVEDENSEGQDQNWENRPLDVRGNSQDRSPVASKMSYLTKGDQVTANKSRPSSQKKRQAEQLKRQIRLLTENIKSNGVQDSILAEKMRKCEEIKKRYRRKNKEKVEDSSQQQKEQESECKLPPYSLESVTQLKVMEPQQQQTAKRKTDDPEQLYSESLMNLIDQL